MANELKKTRMIITTKTLSLTKAEVIDYIRKGVRRDHSDLKGYELTVIADADDDDTLAVTVTAMRTTGDGA